MGIFDKLFGKDNSKQVKDKKDKCYKDQKDKCYSEDVFELPRPRGHAACDVHLGESIPRGSGYLHVSKEVVEFRKDARTMSEARSKEKRQIASMKQMVDSWGGGSFTVDSALFTPYLMCEAAARERGIDLDVAAADAEYWWKTGFVPLRATPRRRRRKG